MTTNPSALTTGAFRGVECGWKRSTPNQVLFRPQKPTHKKASQRQSETDGDKLDTVTNKKEDKKGDKRKHKGDKAVTNKKEDTARQEKD